jgi:hypothetical protein
MGGRSVPGTIGFRSLIDVDRTAHHGTNTGSDQLTDLFLVVPFFQTNHTTQKGGQGIGVMNQG